MSTTVSTGRTHLRINRTKPFDSVHFIGEGWSIWRGPMDREGLDGEEQQCGESLALTEVDIAKVARKTCLDTDETYVIGEELLLRLKNDKALLFDAEVCKTLYENQHLIPDSWKGKCIYFFGTELRSRNGDRCVLCLCWYDARWRVDYCWLDLSFDSRDCVAVGGE